MPDDRLFHTCLGQSDKVNSLTDFEELVWRDYINAADDFGIMRFSAVTLQAKFDRLANRPAKAIERALARVLAVGLITAFTHQSRVYCFQNDWQDWQHVSYPRRTAQPLPTGALLEQCSLNTRWLFTRHPDGGKLEGGWKAPKEFTVRSYSGEIPETVRSKSENIPATRARPLAVSHSREPLAVSHEPACAPSALAGTLPRDHVRHSWCSSRGKCVPDFLHEQFIASIGGERKSADQRLRAFYEAVQAGWPEGPIGDKPLDLWQREFAAKFPSVAPVTSGKTAGNYGALASFATREKP